MVNKLSRYLGCFIALILFISASNSRAQNVWTKLADVPAIPPNTDYNFTGHFLCYQYVGDSTVYALEYRDSIGQNFYGPVIIGSIMKLYRSNNVGGAWRLADSLYISHKFYLRRFINFKVRNDKTFTLFGSEELGEGGSYWGPVWELVNGSTLSWGSPKTIVSDAEYSLGCTSRDQYDFIVSSLPSTDIGKERESPRLMRIDSPGSWDSILKSTTVPPIRNVEIVPTFRSHDEGFVVGGANPARVFRTIDGGASWQSVHFPGEDATHSLWGVAFAAGSRNRWFALCSFYDSFKAAVSYAMLKSSDSGASWTVDSVAPIGGGKIYMSGDSSVYYWRQGSTILFKNDQATGSWAPVLFNLPGEPTSIGDSILYAGGYETDMTQGVNSAGLTLSTNSFFFDSLEYGKSKCATLYIHSIGNAPLQLVFPENSDTSLFLNRTGIVTLIPGDSLALTICCNGWSEASTSRVLHISNNSGSQDSLISVTWRVRVPRIARIAQPLDLGDIVLGDTVLGRMLVGNQGESPLSIDSVHFLDDNCSGLIAPVNGLGMATLRPAIHPHQIGPGATHLVLFTNDPSLPRDTITFVYWVLDSSRNLRWAVMLNNASDTSDQIATEVVCDARGGAFLSEKVMKGKAVLRHLDSSGSMDASLFARDFIGVAIIPDHDPVVAKGDSLFTIGRYSKDLTRLYWQDTLREQTMLPLFLRLAINQKVALCVATKAWGSIPGTYDYGDVLTGQFDSLGRYLAFVRYDASVANIVSSGIRIYPQTYADAIAIDSDGRSYDLVCYADSVTYDFHNNPKFYWHTVAGRFIWYNLEQWGRLEADRFGHLLILFNDKLLKVDTMGHVLLQTNTTKNDLAVDAQGSVYLLDRYDLGITKLDSNLQFVWQHSYLGDDDAPGISSAIALDRWGNVYATGTSIGQDGSADAVTMKYSPDGNRRWITKYAGLPGTPDSGSKIAVDAQGAVFVLASTTTAKGHKGLTLLKYLPPQDSFANTVAEHVEAAIQGLQIFPNPAKDQVTIAYHPRNTSGERGRELIVTDITGREIVKKLMSNRVGESTVSLQNLSNGLYFVRVLGEGVGAKFVVER